MLWSTKFGHKLRGRLQTLPILGLQITAADLTRPKIYFSRSPIKQDSPSTLETSGIGMLAEVLKLTLLLMIRQKDYRSSTSFAEEARDTQTHIILFEACSFSESMLSRCSTEPSMTSVMHAPQTPSRQL